MFTYFRWLNTCDSQYSWNILRVIILLMLSNILVGHSYAANPRTPSQALPEMFRGQANPDYYDLKEQEQILPNLETKQPLEQQSDTGIKIIPETLIILAPKELQNIIDIDNSFVDYNWPNNLTHKDQWVKIKNMNYYNII